jgi:glycosyltransferase involved in cell wall biosynthesis
MLGNTPGVAHGLSNGFKVDNLVSVVVCTYNRAAKLEKCLDALLAMNEPDGIRWEVVCVDSSTDGTKLIVEEFARHSRIPIRYVFESDLRLSCARNAGLRHALGDILAFTDDDCLVDPNWLVNIWKAFDEDASLAMLGGRLELRNNDDLPISVRLCKERVTLGLANFLNLIGTSNMAFRRRVISRVGMFDPEFGPGSSLLGAEDSDFVYRGLKAGFKTIYDPDVLAFHDHGRRTELDRIKTERGYIIARGALYLKNILQGDRQAMRLAFWESVPLVKQVFGSVAWRKASGD